MPLAVLGLPLVTQAQPDNEWGSTLSPEALAPDLLHVADDLEVTVWATSPLLYNPTNMDVDAEGRIWVCEGVNYRGHAGRRPEGDRVVILEDSNGDG